MARPKRDGLLYFSLDTDFFYADRRIRALKSRYGSDGIVFYIYLLTEIYREGYYTRWNTDSMEAAMDELGFTEGLIEQIMAFLVSRSLLTEVSILTDPDTAITSPGIQKRYQEAAKSLRRDVEVDRSIWLLSEEETAPFIKFSINPDKYGKNPDKSSKNGGKCKENPIKENKTNKNKEKENKEKTPHSAKAPQAGTQAYYPDNKELDAAFRDYADMRKKIRKPMTEKAVDLAMKKLEKLSCSTQTGKMDSDMAVAILEQSILNSWQGLYPLKEPHDRAPGKKKESEISRKLSDETSAQLEGYQEYTGFE